LIHFIRQDRLRFSGDHQINHFVVVAVPRPLPFVIHRAEDEVFRFGQWPAQFAQVGNRHAAPLRKERPALNAGVQGRLRFLWQFPQFVQR
jgi:hypothetical protein